MLKTWNFGFNSSNHETTTTNSKTGYLGVVKTMLLLVITSCDVT